MRPQTLLMSCAVLALAACSNPVSSDATARWIAVFDHVPTAADQQALTQAGAAHQIVYPIAHSVGFDGAGSGQKYFETPGVTVAFAISSVDALRPAEFRTSAPPTLADQQAILAAGGTIDKIDPVKWSITGRLAFSKLSALSNTPSITLVVVGCDCSRVL
ncbi:MAG: hypothetical protein V4503_03295 [Gemmatimonadota bacterium]